MVIRTSSCGLEGVHANLISLCAGFLHISASCNSARCVWGECLIHDELTFHQAHRADVSRLEVTWASLSNPVGGTRVAHSRVHGYWWLEVRLVPGEKPLFPATSFFSLHFVKSFFCFVLDCKLSFNKKTKSRQEAGQNDAVVQGQFTSISF